MATDCGIAAFLVSQKELARRILDYLRSLEAGHKTGELQRAEQFLQILPGVS